MKRGLVGYLRNYKIVKHSTWKFAIGCKNWAGGFISWIQDSRSFVIRWLQVYYCDICLWLILDSTRIKLLMTDKRGSWFWLRWVLAWSIVIKKIQFSKIATTGDFHERNEACTVWPGVPPIHVAAESIEWGSFMIPVEWIGGSCQFLELSRSGAFTNFSFLRWRFQYLANTR